VATAFTHAVVGGALCVLGPERVPRVRLAASGALLAVLPDLDVLAFAADIPYGHWLGHRGFLHSVPFALGAGLLVTRFAFPALPRSSRTWWAVALLLAFATASHGLLDALTDAGLGVAFLLPFDDTRVFLPWRPLPTSPVGIGAFFRGPGAAILAEEIALVWLPVLLLVGGLSLARRSARPGAAGDDPGLS
jgi:inner membrane protein